MDQSKKFTWAEEESEDEISDSEEALKTEIKPIIEKEKTIEKHSYDKLVKKIKEADPPYIFKLTNINYNVRDKWEIYDFLGLRYSEAKLELLKSRNRFNGIVIATAYSQNIGIKIAKRYEEEFRGRRIKISLEENGKDINEPDKLIDKHPEVLIRSKIEASENNRMDKPKIEIVKVRKIVIAPDAPKKESIWHPESTHKGESIDIPQKALNNMQNILTENKRNPFGQAHPIDRREKDLRFDQEHFISTSSTDTSSSHPRDEKIEYQINSENLSIATMHENQSIDSSYKDENSSSSRDKSPPLSEHNPKCADELKENKKHKANPFGSAKPVDTLSKDIEFEKKSIEKTYYVHEKNQHTVPNIRKKSSDKNISEKIGIYSKHTKT